MPVPRASYLILLCCGSAVFANSPPSAEPATSLETSEVVVYVHQVERRAAATSFAALQQFGQSALKQADAGALSRLQHVTRLMISQGEYGPAEEWNRQLAERAGQLGNARYLAMARINTLRIRNLREPRMDAAEIEAAVQAQTDWLAQVYAETVLARRRMDDGRVGDAYRRMLDAVARIPQDQAGEASIASAVWEVIANLHLMVDDVHGYMKAVDKVEGYISKSDYPRPDYETVYNLAQSLSFLGRHEEASVLASTYGRLARRTATPTAQGYAGHICAFTAAYRDDWAGVLGCVEPFGPALSAPGPTRDAMQPLRAEAYARTGQVASASRDMDELHARIAAGRMARTGGVMRAEAELLIARGDTHAGVAALRAYHLARFQRVTRSAAAMMEQLTETTDLQLAAAAEQDRLKTQAMKNQWLLSGVLMLSGLALVALAAVMARQRRKYREQAITDALTGLPNRRYTEKRVTDIIEHAVARSGQAVVAIIDLDHFKSCNDRFGHDGGEEALKTFASIAKASLRPGDVFGRWGGEEFLLAVPDTSLDDAVALLRRIALKASEARLASAPEYV